MIGHLSEDPEVVMKPKGALGPILMSPLACYLNATVSTLGYNSGLLEVKSNLNEADACLVLHNRVFDGYEPVDYNLCMCLEKIFTLIAAGAG